MKHNILLLLIDCLRHDRCLRGSGKHYDTPFIDYLSMKGTNFSQAISVTSFTSPCVTSILTGVYPFRHGIERQIGKLKPECVTLAEILKKAGYTTCAMVTGPLWPQLGINRGFDYYLYRDADVTIYTGLKDKLESYLEKMRKPWFTFVHLWELHFPRYLPKRSKLKYRFSVDIYDRALTCLDHELLTILEKIDLDETIVMLLSDHGEQLPSSFESIYRNVLACIMRTMGSQSIPWYKLWEFVFKIFPNLSKIQGHSFNIYDSQIRVPLIFAGNGFPKNKTVKQQVSQIDILPTIIDALGLSRDLDIEVEGRSLMPLINNAHLPKRAVYIGPAGIFEKRGGLVEGLRTSKWKYISVYDKGAPLELYDLESDPKETENLVGANKEIVRKFRRELRKIKSSHTSSSLEITQDEKRKLRERLKTLGYF